MCDYVTELRRRITQQMGFSAAFLADANIFIDFSEAGVLEKLASAGFALSTTDLIIAEMKIPALSELQAMDVAIINLDSQRMLRLAELSEIYRKTSVADLSALVVAEHLKAILLTGDGALRQAADQIGVEVHGTIWLMNHIVTAQIFTRSKADQLLELMRRKGRRLPLSP